MGNKLNCQFAACLPEKTYNKRKILLMGIKSSGKTTILYQFLFQNFLETVPSFANIETFKYKNNKIMLCEIGGDLSNHSNSWENYSKNTDGIIFVVDNTFIKKKKYINDLLIDVLNHKSLINIPILFYGLYIYVRSNNNIYIYVTLL